VFDVASAKPKVRKASMGPRPRGRGMILRRRATALSPPGFNGAAPARARNGRGGVARRLRAGLASMGPRPRGRGMRQHHHQLLLGHRASMGPRPRGRGMVGAGPLLHAREPQLQWGRARAGAECSSSIGTPLNTSSLQWGRARAGAEWYRTIDHWALRGWLQWGRARAGAECGKKTQLPRLRKRSFNGAAPARARNAARGACGCFR